MARTVKLAKFQQPGGYLEMPEDIKNAATLADITSAVADHEALPDPHPQYALESALGTASALASDTDGTLAANSDARLATQKAVKTYVDNAVTGLWDVKGGTDCSANPNYPAALKGDAYVVTVAGKIGGASGTSVDVGDVFIAFADNAGGTEAAVGSSWENLEHNLAGVALLSGGTFTGDISVPDEAYDATAWNGSLEVPTKNAIRDKIETLGSAGVGAQIGRAYTETATTATNASTTIPYDNTIPQSSEGDAFAALDTTITPNDAASLLEIELVMAMAGSAAIDLVVALFRDAGANAIAVQINTAGGTNHSRNLVIKATVAAGSISPTTFKVRWGRSGGTGYINRASTASLYGGVYKSSMTIREIKQ